MMYSVAMREGTSLQEAVHLPDDEILALSIERPVLFALLVRKYEEPFLRKAARIVGGKEEAEDVVQEAFVKIYMNAAKFKKQEGASFSSWGYRILINTALTHYQKQKRAGTTNVVLDEEVWALIPDRNLRQFEKKELADVVASVLTRMPPILAKALTAFFIEGKPQEEMASEAGVSVGAIKTRVHRAKLEFKKIYNAITTNS